MSLRHFTLLGLLFGLVALLPASLLAEQAPAPDPVEAVEAEADDAPSGEATGKLANGALGGAEFAMVGGADALEAAPRRGVDKPGVRIDLLGDRAELVPGSTARIAVRMSMEEGWHTYYGPNPGAFSLPVKISWTVPDGYEVGEIVWPAPHRYKEPTGDISYVYEESVVLTAELRVPETAKPGTDVVIASKVSYQVCKTNCVTGKVELSLPLPVVATSTVAQEAAWLAPFEQADAVRPRVASDGYVSNATPSHTPLRPGDTIVAVVDIEVPKDSTLDAPDENHPLIIFERIKGLSAEVVEVSSPEANTRRIVLRVAATEELVETGAIEWPALVQGQSVTNGKKTPVAVLATLPLTLAAANAEVAAVESPLLSNIDVDAFIGEDGELAALEIEAPVQEELPLWQALLFALLGGIILNIMPCVLPVLSLKALAIVEEADESQHRVQSFVGMYVLGVLASFWALAGVIIAVKLSGQYAGWGFQFQEPGYVLVMSAAIFAFALSLFGVFEIPGLTTSGGGSAGLKGSFVHGIMTTALSTPCSAPLLGSALTFALTQSPVMIMVIFTLVGVGLALPVALLTLSPGLRKYIPRPGPWMETFKHVIAFMLVGTVIWLLGILTAQLTSDGMFTVLVLMGLVAVASWILGRWTGPLAPRKSKLIAMFSAGLVVAIGISVLNLEAPLESGESLASDRIDWQRFEGDATIALAGEGHTVFIDFTADWCATCKANEATAIETDAVAALIRENNIVAVKADLTRRDPELTRWVEFYGRAAIPLYVILPAGKPNRPILLPEVITEGMLLDTLRKAGPSEQAAAAQSSEQRANL